MINSRKLKENLNDANTEIAENINNMRVVAKDAKRVSNIAKNAHIIITDLDRQFETATKLNNVDISFLFLAVALQVVRQYFITNFKERTGHDKAEKPAKKTEKDVLDKLKIKDNKDRKNMAHDLYKPSLQEVAFNPVPFDQTMGVSSLGGPKIGGGFEHRAKTPGHDAILGYIFGTANIATATLTTWDMQSFHIKYGEVGNGLRPMATHNAVTPKIFDHIYKRVMEDAVEGGSILAISLFREAIHLKSDINSKVSLPVPIVTTISPDLAKEVAKYGFDLANLKTVGKQALYAGLINTIIAMLHRLMYDYNGAGNISLYEVRTRKILSYSNIIASVSNLIAVAIGSIIGLSTSNPDMVKKSLSYLDIGGYMVAIYRIVTDYNFIKQVKQEFLEKEFYKIVMGEEYNF